MQAILTLIGGDMRTQRYLAFALIGLFLSSAWAATVPVKQKKEEPAKLSKEAKARIAKAAEPGPQHKILGVLVGSWEESTRSWTTPKDKPEPKKGTSETKWILDGRFLEQKFSGSVQGQKIEALGLFGYDTLGEKFSLHWYDTGSTAVRTTFGTYDEASKTLNASGTVDDPASGTQKPIRTALRFIDNDTHVFELYISMPNGLELRALEVVSKRKKV